jgi:hypothetical protein
MKRKTNNLTNRAAWDKLPPYFELTLEEGLEFRPRKVTVAKAEAKESGCVWACNLEIFGNGRTFKLATFKLRDYNKGNIEQCLIVSDVTPNPFAEEDGVIVGSLSAQLHAMIEKRGKLKAV